MTIDFCFDRAFPRRNSLRGFHLSRFQSCVFALIVNFNINDSNNEFVDEQIETVCTPPSARQAE